MPKIPSSSSPSSSCSPTSKKRKIQPDGKVSDPKTTPKSSKTPRTLQKKSSKPQLNAAAAVNYDGPLAAGTATATTFDELSLPALLRNAISGLGISDLSPLQRQAVPTLLNGRDLFAVAEPSRDAMLSLLVPAVALLDKRRFHTRHGTGVLIVTPNRETAVEISGLASALLAGTTHTVGMVIEGANRGSEEEKLERGVNLLVATPVRLLEHLKDLPSFVIKNMKAFFVYGPGAETDKQIREILTYIPKKSRISAVVTEKADEFQGLVELVCRPDSIQRYELASSASTAAKGPQGYVIVEADKRFLLLYSFLKKFQRKKIVVLVSSTLSVLFCEEALSSLELSVYSVHGRQNAKSRLTAFSDFLKDAEGTLVCTEEAVHGLEVSPADWVIHYDPPTSVKDFICRRGAIQGRSVAFTLPEESGFVDALKAADVAVEEFDFPKNKLINVQSKLEKLVSKNFELHQAAKNGFRAFLQDYNHHVDAKIFDVSKLNVQKVAKSFGFDTPPRVEIKVKEEVIVDKFKRTYGPEKPKSGKKRKAQ